MNTPHDEQAARELLQQEWEVSQGIHLESSNPKTLSALIGKFQGTVQVSAVNYGLSSAAGNAAKQEMTATAIKAFHSHAQAIAKNMGYDEYRISSMNIQAWDDANGGGYYDYGSGAIAAHWSWTVASRCTACW
jgi:predicted secreted protein